MNLNDNLKKPVEGKPVSAQELPVVNVTSSIQ